MPSIQATMKITMSLWSLQFALSLVVVTFSRSTMAFQFEESTRIECTGLDKMEDQPPQLQNCSFFENSQNLCEFTWDGDAICGGMAGVASCDYNETTGKVSTVRYTFIVDNANQCQSYADCGNNCVGKPGNGVLAREESPLKFMTCPASTNSSCSYTLKDDELQDFATPPISNASGTFYSLQKPGVGAVCDNECSVNSGAWGRRHAGIDALLAVVVSTSIFEMVLF